MAEVPTDHRWDDPAYVAEWAETAAGQAHRQVLLDAIGSSVESAGARRVLELGSGPGFLAEHLLARVPGLDYWALDLSPHMHALAAERLAAHPGVHFVVGDFREPDWPRDLPGAFDAVVSLQAVHELRRANRIPRLYREVATLLRPGGLLVVADLVNAPDRPPQDHLMTAEEHRDALVAAGFAEPVRRGDVGWIVCFSATTAPATGAAPAR